MRIVPPNVVEEVLSRPTPAIIGISGFGGAGKTTAANALGEEIHAPVIGVDSFFKNNHQENYERWEIIDFERLRREVMIPFKRGEHELRYGHFDWNKDRIAEERIVEHGGRILIEGVGLFRPELNDDFTYKIWVQCSLAQAIERGKRRDREVHKNPQDAFWDGVWKRNDQEYYGQFNPIEAADVIVDNS